MVPDGRHRDRGIEDRVAQACRPQGVRAGREALDREIAELVGQPRDVSQRVGSWDHALGLQVERRGREALVRAERVAELAARRRVLDDDLSGHDGDQRVEEEVRRRRGEQIDVVQRDLAIHRPARNISTAARSGGDVVGVGEERRDPERVAALRVRERLDRHPVGVEGRLRVDLDAAKQHARRGGLAQSAGQGLALVQADHAHVANLAGLRREAAEGHRRVVLAAEKQERRVPIGLRELEVVGDVGKQRPDAEVAVGLDRTSGDRGPGQHVASVGPRVGGRGDLEIRRERAGLGRADQDARVGVLHPADDHSGPQKNDVLRAQVGLQAGRRQRRIGELDGAADVFRRRDAARDGQRVEPVGGDVREAVIDRVDQEAEVRIAQRHGRRAHDLLALVVDRHQERLRVLQSAIERNRTGDREAVAEREVHAREADAGDVERLADARHEHRARRAGAQIHGAHQVAAGGQVGDRVGARGRQETRARRGRVERR